MSQKKNKSKLYHFLFHTRQGFYSLFVVTVILMISTAKSFSPEPLSLSVLGESDNRGKENNEKKREEKKEEIRSEFKIETEGLKVKFKSENGKVERKIEAKEELDLDEDKEEELEDEIEEEFEEENEAEIATDSSSVVITKRKIKARTGFPLTIDLATNQLIVTRPDGTTKTVAILPDQAVANFMRHKKVNLINVPENPVGTGSAGTDDGTPSSSSAPTLEEEQTQVSLTDHKGLLVYEIKGKKRLRILGLIPVNVNTTGFVSAETGEVVDQEESLFTRLLNLISL